MKKIILFSLLATILLVAACTTTGIDEKKTKNNNAPDDFDNQNSNGDIAQKDSNDKIAKTHWLDYDLKDVNSGTNFKISDYKGKNAVLLETFAVWCVNCKQQQDQIKEFHKTNPEIISISVNADPNESEEAVLEFTAKNGYDWRYVVAKQSFMNLLLDEFGLVIANAPASPIVLICEDQSYTLLPTGIKTAKELSEAVEMSC